MLIDELIDDVAYPWTVFSKVLRELGLPHNRHSVLKYEDDGLVRIGRIPLTHKKMIMGKEIKDAVVRIQKRAGLQE